jgi:tripartite-type tricarboxylate transporter receptor subunit TctC
MHRDLILYRRSLLGAGLALATTRPALAQQPWAPNRPIRLVVGFPPGGATDVLARWVGQQLSPRLGQPLVIENRPGANASLGSQYVQHASPDGHTLLFTTADTHSVNPVVYRHLPYQPERFVPVAGIARLLFALAVRPGLEARSLQDFVTLAKNAPQPMTYSSWGVGSTSQVMMETFAAETGLKLTHVPFQGAAPAVQALIANQVDAFMLPIGVATAQGGRVRVLGLVAPQRFAGAPEVPTFAEQGFGLEGDLWFGILAPPETPMPIVDRIAREMHAIATSPEAATFLTPNGYVADPADRAGFLAHVQADDARWKERTRRLGVVLDQ